MLRPRVQQQQAVAAGAGEIRQHGGGVLPQIPLDQPGGGEVVNHHFLVTAAVLLPADAQLLHAVSPEIPQKNLADFTGVALRIRDGEPFVFHLAQIVDMHLPVFLVAQAGAVEGIGLLLAVTVEVVHQEGGAMLPGLGIFQQITAAVVHIFADIRLQRLLDGLLFPRPLGRTELVFHIQAHRRTAGQRRRDKKDRQQSRRQPFYVLHTIRLLAVHTLLS